MCPLVLRSQQLVLRQLNVITHAQRQLGVEQVESSVSVVAGLLECSDQPRFLDEAVERHVRDVLMQRGSITSDAQLASESGITKKQSAQHRRRFHSSLFYLDTYKAMHMLKVVSVLACRQSGNRLH